MPSWWWWWAGWAAWRGPIWRALLIGLLQAFGIVLLPKITLVLVFVVMAAVLAVRPHGLLGPARMALARGEADTWALIRPAGAGAAGLGRGGAGAGGGGAVFRRSFRCCRC